MPVDLDLDAPGSNAVDLDLNAPTSGVDLDLDAQPDQPENPTWAGIKGYAKGFASELPIIGENIVAPIDNPHSNVPGAGVSRFLSPLVQGIGEFVLGSRLGGAGGGAALAGIGQLERQAKEHRLAKMQETGQDPGMMAGYRDLNRYDALTAGVAAGLPSGLGKIGGAIGASGLNPFVKGAAIVGADVAGATAFTAAARKARNPDAPLSDLASADAAKEYATNSLFPLFLGAVGHGASFLNSEGHTVTDGPMVEQPPPTPDDSTHPRMVWPTDQGVFSRKTGGDVQNLTGDIRAAEQARSDFNRSKPISTVNLDLDLPPPFTINRETIAAPEGIAADTAANSGLESPETQTANSVEQNQVAGNAPVDLDLDAPAIQPDEAGNATPIQPEGQVIPNAVQEQSPREMDVRQQPGNGEAMAGGYAQGEEAAGEGQQEAQQVDLDLDTQGGEPNVGRTGHREGQENAVAPAQVAEPENLLPPEQAPGIAPTDEETAQMQPVSVKKAPKPMKGWQTSRTRGAVEIPPGIARGAEVAGEATKQFGQQDVIPALKSAGRVAKQMFLSPRNYWEPIEALPDSEKDIMYDFTGQRALRADQLKAQTAEIEKHIASLPRSEQIAFVDRTMKGAPESDPKLAEFRRFFREREDTNVEQRAESGKPVDYLKDYVAGLWNLHDDQDIPDNLLHNTPANGAKYPYKSKKFGTMSEGMGAINKRTGKNYDPLTTNLSRILRYSDDNTGRLVGWSETERRLLANGSATLEKEAPRGWKRLDVPGVDPDISFNPKLYTVLKNHFESDTFRNNPVTGDTGNALIKLKDFQTRAELMYPGIHYAFTGITDTGSMLGRKLSGAWNKIFDTPELQSSPARWVPQTVSHGHDVIDAATNFDTFKDTPQGKQYISRFKNEADAKRVSELLYLGGFRVRGEEMFANTKEAAAKGNYIGSGIRALRDSMDVPSWHLLNDMIPAVKASNFVDDFLQERQLHAKDLDSGKMTDVTLARRVMKQVENKFGEVNYQNKFMNKFNKTLAMFLTRAPGFRTGTMKFLAKDVTINQMAEVGKAIKDSIEGRTVKMPRMTSGTGTLIATMATHALMSTLISNMFGDKEDNGKTPLLDMGYPRVGGKDAHGNPNRIKFLDYASEAFTIARNPLHYITSAASAPVSRIREAMNNRDYYGRQVFDETAQGIAGKAKAAVDILKHLVSPNNFLFSGMKHEMQDKDTPFLKALGRNTFANPAPSDLTQTPDEELLSKFAQQDRAQAGLPEEEWQTRTLKSRARAALRQKDTGPLMAAYKSGKLSMDDVNRLVADVKDTPQQASFKHLDLGQAIRVYQVASPQRQQQYMPYLETKLNELPILSQEKRDELMPLIKQLVASVKQQGAAK